MVVAYRNVTRGMLASADTVVAIEPGAPCEEKVVFQRRVVPMHETARVIVVLLEPGDLDEQLRALRGRVVEAKSQGEFRPTELNQIADALEWLEAPRG